MKSNTTFLYSFALLLAWATPPTQAQAMETVIARFFENYSLITSKGFPAFAEVQGTLLSPKLVTLVRDHQGTHRYEGPSGYLASLGDWSKNFSTGTDFGLVDLGRSGSKYTIGIKGTIYFKNGSVTRTITDREHCWQELFTLDPAGKILLLEVNMNLQCRRYPS